METEYVDSTLSTMPAKSYVTAEPLGVVLILGTWNLPYFTTIGPLINAIAAGNCALMKPSEITPHSSVVM